jgi:hypothetical protein
MQQRLDFLAAEKEFEWPKELQGRDRRQILHKNAVE